MYLFIYVFLQYQVQIGIVVTESVSILVCLLTKLIIDIEPVSFSERKTCTVLRTHHRTPLVYWTCVGDIE